MIIYKQHFQYDNMVIWKTDFFLNILTSIFRARFCEDSFWFVCPSTVQTIRISVEKSTGNFLVMSRKEALLSYFLQF